MGIHTLVKSFLMSFSNYDKQFNVRLSFIYLEPISLLCLFFCFKFFTLNFKKKNIKVLKIVNVLYIVLSHFTMVFIYVLYLNKNL
jgi:hypothetical protein